MIFENGQKLCIRETSYSVPDLLRVRKTQAPVQLFHFHAVFRKKYASRLAPPTLGNPGSAIDIM